VTRSKPGTRALDLKECDPLQSPLMTYLMLLDSYRRNLFNSINGVVIKITVCLWIFLIFFSLFSLFYISLFNNLFKMLFFSLAIS
jgi:hypothetical protein